MFRLRLWVEYRREEHHWQLTRRESLVIVLSSNEKNSPHVLEFTKVLSCFAVILGISSYLGCWIWHVAKFFYLMKIFLLKYRVHTRQYRPLELKSANSTDRQLNLTLKKISWEKSLDITVEHLTFWFVSSLLGFAYLQPITLPTLVATLRRPNSGTFKLHFLQRQHYPETVE